MLYIGIDAGGTKSKLLARSTGQLDLTLVGPAANLQAAGLDAVAQTFTDLVRKAIAAYPGETLHAVCAGVAGAGSAEDRVALTAEWRRRLGVKAPPHLIVHHDAVIAVEGAFEGASGVIVIAGTGSIAFAKTHDGALHRVGGWGHLLGDEGSGYIIGLEGLKAVASAMDGGPPTRLQQILAERTGVDTPEEIIQIVYQEKGRAPQFAQTVVQAAQDGDAVSQRIVEEQLAHLAEQVRWLVNRCGPVDKQVALIGGLTTIPYFRAMLEHRLNEVLPGWRIGTAAREPAEGALRFAMAAV